MDADAAADDIDLSPFDDWSDRERIAVNVHTVYRGLDPSLPALPSPSSSCAWQTGLPGTGDGPPRQSPSKEGRVTFRPRPRGHGRCLDLGAPDAATSEPAGHTVQAIDLPGAGADTTPVEDVSPTPTRSASARRWPSSPSRPSSSAAAWAASPSPRRQRAATERIALLVYVAAFLPRAGQSLMDLTQLPEGADDQVQANLVVTGEPPVATAPGAGREGGRSSATAPRSVAAWAIERLGEQAARSLPGARRRPRRTTCPSPMFSARAIVRSRRRCSAG